MEQFSKHEPAGQLLGFNYQIVMDVFQLLFPHFTDNDLSVMAIDDATDKIVGIFTAWDPFKFEELSFTSQFSIGWKLDGVLNKHKCFKPFW